jgi:hypothetical protein
VCGPLSAITGRHGCCTSLLYTVLVLDLILVPGCVLVGTEDCSFVARVFDEASDGALGVVLRNDHDTGPEPRAVLADSPAFVPVEAEAI